MSFSDTIFLFFLALILFGPKKLPEMARQAGRLLAELRRASNEFRSQIETEIAHLEVEKSQTVLPSTPPPQGTVASLSLNPAASEPAPQDAPDTLAGPAAEAAPRVVNSAEPAPVAPSSSELPSDPAAEPHVSTSQESHV
ncbi:MAG TPA: twin-arginine translocase TatA/TatE family subunit [Candidatus Acidoferrum sp.]|jgi:sec-independent protein translocase protein TatB|nr:twin-arginine translocase TatA/TatE family subunit [Candidatus Acidoferrum sp.]